MIDSLFTSQGCVVYITKIGNMIRDQRHLFLHKGCWPRFKGIPINNSIKLRSKSLIGN